MKKFYRVLSCFIIITIFASIFPLNPHYEGNEVYGVVDGDTTGKLGNGGIPNPTGGVRTGSGGNYYPTFMVTLTRNKAYSSGGSEKRLEKVVKTLKTKWPTLGLSKSLYFVNSTVSVLSNSKATGYAYYDSSTSNMSYFLGGRAAKRVVHLRKNLSTAPSNDVAKKLIDKGYGAPGKDLSDFANSKWQKEFSKWMNLDEAKAIWEYILTPIGNKYDANARINKVVSSKYASTAREKLSTEGMLNVSCGYVGLLYSLYLISSDAGLENTTAEYVSAINDYLAGKGNPSSIVLSTAVPMVVKGGSPNPMYLEVPTVDYFRFYCSVPSSIVKNPKSKSYADTYKRLLGEADASIAIAKPGTPAAKKMNRLSDGNFPTNPFSWAASVLVYPHSRVTTKSGKAEYAYSKISTGLMDMITFDADSNTNGYMIISFNPIIPVVLPDFKYKVDYELKETVGVEGSDEVKPEEPAKIDIYVTKSKQDVIDYISKISAKSYLTFYDAKVKRTTYVDGKKVGKTQSMPELEASLNKVKLNKDKAIDFVQKKHTITLLDKTVLNDVYTMKEKGYVVTYKYDIDVTYRVGNSSVAYMEDVELLNGKFVYTTKTRKYDSARYKVGAVIDDPTPPTPTPPVPPTPTPPVPDDPTPPTPTPPVPDEEEKDPESTMENSYVFTSTQNAYGEVKSNTVNNEKYEAMAGIPSTETLYFAAGGQEYMLSIVLQYWMNEKSVPRKYRSHYTGNVNCEYLDNDTYKGGSGYKESSQLVAPSGASSSNIQPSSSHTSSTRFYSTWTGTIANNTSDPGIVGFKPGSAGNPCAGSGADMGNIGSMGPMTNNWDMSAYNAAVEQAYAFAEANKGKVIIKVADSDDESRQWTTVVGNPSGLTYGRNAASTAPGAGYTLIPGTPASVVAPSGCPHGCTKVWDKEPVGAVAPDKNGNGGSDAKPGVSHVHNHNHGSFTAATTSKTQKESNKTYTITVEIGTLPAHYLCGPCCDHVLPDVEDTWVQEALFDYAKISQLKLYKIDQASAEGMEEVTGIDTVFASITQGDPTYFMNIAQLTEKEGTLLPEGDVADYLTHQNTYFTNDNREYSQTSKAGRLRYSLEPTQHDEVLWEEGARTNKCDGMTATNVTYASADSSNKVVKATGHKDHPWAKGILYTNTEYTNEYDFHMQKDGLTDKTKYSDKADNVDIQTVEWKKFDARRRTKNTVTVISDFLILQTSGGDQSIFYFAKSSKPTESQKKFDKIEATEKEMFTDNPNSIFKAKAKTEQNQLKYLKYVSKNFINIGGFNGKYNLAGIGEANNWKYKPYNELSGQFLNVNGTQVSTVFDNDIANTITRPSRNGKMYLKTEGLQIMPTTPNGVYNFGESKVFYKQMLGYLSTDTDKDVDLMDVYFHDDQLDLQSDYEDYWGDGVGLEFLTTYNNSIGVNPIVIYSPVSTENATVLPLNPILVDGVEVSRDQRVDAFKLPNLNDELNKNKVCPLDPGDCEFRVLNCHYYEDTKVADFDFEPSNTTLNGSTWVTTNKVKGTKYSLPSGFNVESAGKVGSGSYLSAKGVRWSLPLADLGLSTDSNNVIKVEMDFYMDANATNNSMLVSFGNYDFWLNPNDGASFGMFNTGAGSAGKYGAKLVNGNAFKKKVDLVLEFGLNNVTDCKAYIDGVECTSTVMATKPEWQMINGVKTQVEVAKVMPMDISIDAPTNLPNSYIGNYINIGSWNVDSNYPANFYIDNLQIYLKGGNSNHTSTCYSDVVTHEQGKIHVHDDSCYSKENVYTCDNALNSNYQHSTSSPINWYVLGCNENSSGTTIDGANSKTFNYTGRVQTVTLQPGKYLIEAWGAQGGNALSARYYGGVGGLGGYSKGTLTITTPTTYYLIVGGQGSSNGSNGRAYGGNGGFGAGGAGANAWMADYASGGAGGGGLSGLFKSTSYTSSFVIIAGGGGGGGGSASSDGSSHWHGTNGGAGGGTVADAGSVTLSGATSVSHKTSSAAGQGGSQSSGGSSGGSLAGSGGLLFGGYGYGFSVGTSGVPSTMAGGYASTTSNSSSSAGGSGGGGGGYYGGGGSGSYGIGGGGGSGYIGGVTAGSMQKGVNTGNGRITITSQGHVHTGSEGSTANGCYTAGVHKHTGTAGIDSANGCYTKATAHKHTSSCTYISSGEIVCSGEPNTLSDFNYHVHSASCLEHITALNSKTFNYTGDVQTYVAPASGYYKFEAWGASGGGAETGVGSAKGLGGYTSGRIYLNKGERVYVNVGGQGTLSTGLGTGGGFNGGGNGGVSGYGGGGATDFRLTDNSSEITTYRNILSGSDSEIGRFVDTLSSSGVVSKVTLPTGKSAIKIAKGAQHIAAAVNDVFKAGNTYKITFDAWTTASSDTLYLDAFPDSLPDYSVKLTSNRKSYTINMSSNLADMNGAYFRFFANSEIFAGDVYITNIRVEDTTEKIDYSSLASRIMVAGGGGGADNAGGIIGDVDDGSGGHGGNIVGGNAFIAGVKVSGTSVGTMTSKVINGGGSGLAGSQVGGYSLGIGESVSLNTDTGGAGGGYFGGLVTNHNNGGGAGGSSYISGYTGVNSVDKKGNPTGSANHYSGKVFTGATMAQGINNGNGKAVITPENSTTNVLNNIVSGAYTDAQVREYLGSELADMISNNETVLHTWNNWSVDDMKGFTKANTSKSGLKGVNGGLQITPGDSWEIRVPVKITDGAAIKEIRVTLDNNTSYTGARVSRNSYVNYTGATVKANTNNQVISFKPSWKGSVDYINFDLMSMPIVSGQTVTVKSIELIGYGSKTSSGSSASSIMHTWSGWSATNMKGFKSLNACTLSNSGSNLLVSDIGFDSYFSVSTSINASSLKAIKVYLTNNTSTTTGQVFYNVGSGHNEAQSVRSNTISANASGQVMIFDFNNLSLSGTISDFRFDTVGNNAAGGSQTITKIELIGYGTKTSGTGEETSTITTVAPAGTVWNYAYTGTQQTFTAPGSGTYSLEVWGAQGGTTGGTSGGLGGYSKGSLTLTAGQNLGIYVGGAGSGTLGGFNGGATGGLGRKINSGGGGGGATDIRTSVSSVYKYGSGMSALTGSGVVSSWIGQSVVCDNPGEGVFGPYLSVTPGIYQVDVYGAGLQYGLPVVYDNNGSTVWSSNVFGRTDISTNHVTYYVTVPSSTNIAEFCWHSNSYSTMKFDYQTITKLNDRVIVAGGGGGSGGDSQGGSSGGSISSGTGGLAGAGGGSVGTDGSQSPSIPAQSGNGGKGATQSSGGVGGISVSTSYSTNDGTYYPAGGGAGGGGYYGGGGGAGGSLGGYDSCHYGYNGRQGNLGIGGNGGSGASSGSGYYSGAGGGGGAGSGYIGGVTGGSTLAAQRAGNGYATIKAVTDITTGSYAFKPVVINYTERFSPVSITYVSPYGNAKATILTNVSKIPETLPNGQINPIFLCKGIPLNAHRCTENCKTIRILSCSEPHHYGEHYDGSNRICWEACGDDANHKHKEDIDLPDGSTTRNARFLQLDYGFTVYYPNRGDFSGNNALGLGYLQSSTGYGYSDNMNTTIWTREKTVRFEFDVIYEGVVYTAFTWIELDVNKELFDFYLPLANREASNSQISFEVEAINCGTEVGMYAGYDDVIPTIYDNALTSFTSSLKDKWLSALASGFQKYDGYGFRDTYTNWKHTQEGMLNTALNSTQGVVWSEFLRINEEVKPTTVNDNEFMLSNRYRTSGYAALHGGHKDTFVDVVGRIGNFAVIDTEDYRFSNFFKTAVEPTEWLIEGFVKKVDDSLQNYYIGDQVDIRGNDIGMDTHWLNTYNTQSWMQGLNGDVTKKNVISQVLTGNLNNIVPLKSEELRIGYDIYTTITTIGNYGESEVQVIPYYYALNLKTGEILPIDVYISKDGIYTAVNKYGNASSGTVTEELYGYTFNLDWTKESARRNYHIAEQLATKVASEYYKKYIYDNLGGDETGTGDVGSPSGTIPLTQPVGAMNYLGTAQMLVLDGHHRTFIGSSTTYGSALEQAKWGTNMNPGSALDETRYITNAQRWHYKLGLPSSAVFVPTGVEPTKETMNIVMNKDFAILSCMSVIAVGETWALEYQQPWVNSLEINGRIYDISGSGIYPIVGVYSSTNSSTGDISIVKPY